MNQIDMGYNWIPVLNNINTKNGEDQLLYDAGKRIIAFITEGMVGAQTEEGWIKKSLEIKQLKGKILQK